MSITDWKLAQAFNSLDRAFCDHLMQGNEAFVFARKEPLSRVPSS